MNIDYQTRGDALILKPSRRIDASSAAAFEEAASSLLEIGPKRIVIDASELDYISSAGLRAMLTVAKKAKSAGGGLTFADARNNVKEVLAVSGFDSIFGIQDSVAQAIGTLEGRPGMRTATLKLEGRLDSATVAKLETEFAAKAGALTDKGDRAIIDLQDLVYISSLGIRMLVTTIKRFHRLGVAFATVRPRDNTANELLITVDLASHLNMVEDAEAAHAQAHEIW